MHYLEVMVGESTFNGKEALTYSSPHPVAVGGLVLVPLRSGSALGFVQSASHKKPAFAVKAIIMSFDLPAIPKAQMQLHSWLRTYYPAPLGVITNLFLPRLLKQKSSPPTVEDPGQQPKAAKRELTSDQTQALQIITKPGLYLLYGETGTGKTQVYSELAARQLQQNKSVIILTPEIGLTTQLVNHFQETFGSNRVVLVHSSLTDNERRNAWLHTLVSKTPLIVIGARSALFSPLDNIGLIVVDEAHETAYKQGQAPYYHASNVAAKLAEICGAQLILGSATPLVTDYFIAHAKNRPIIQMKQIAKGDASPPTITIIDIRKREHFSQSRMLSDTLLADMRTAIEQNEQILLFLNRRGTAKVVFCEHCGWQATCPHCDLPLTYHGDTHSMRCHSCSYRAAPPTNCPSCGHNGILFKGVGTKAIAQEVARLFPDVSSSRFDTDNTKAERMESHYQALKKGDVQIIIGTQTIAKGLDLPRLGLVGVITADSGLSFPDFSAAERTFQLISQVIGRIGRGHRLGKAVIQTYTPDSPLLQAAVAKDWEGFYQTEVTERQRYNFPPFCYMLKLTCRRATQAGAQKTATNLASELAKIYPNAIIEGPAPAFHEKIGGKYQWHIVIKAKRRQLLLDIVNNLPSNWQYEIDPMSLL